MFTLTKTQRHANDINDWYDALFSYEIIQLMEKACWIPSQLCQLSSDDSLCCTSSRYECEVVSFSELQGTGAQWDHTVWAGRRWRSLFGGSLHGSGQSLYLLSEDVLAPSPLLADLLCQLQTRCGWVCLIGIACGGVNSACQCSGELCLELFECVCHSHSCEIV